MAVGIRRRDVRALMQADKEFLEDYRTARGYGAEQIFGQMVKLAIEGVEEPIASGGAIVGTKRVYSDRLLQTMFNGLTEEGKAMLAGKLGIDVNGSFDVNVKVQAGVDLGQVADSCSAASTRRSAGTGRTSTSVSAAGGVPAPRLPRGVLRWRRRRRQVGRAARRSLAVRRRARLRGPDPAAHVPAARPAGRDHGRSKEWLMPHTDGVRWNDDAKRWTFPSGATLTFGYLEHETTSTTTRAPPTSSSAGTSSPSSTRSRTSTCSRAHAAQGSARARHPDPAPLRATRAASATRGSRNASSTRRRARRRVFIPAKVDDNPGLDVAEYKATLLVTSTRRCSSSSSTATGASSRGGAPHHGRPPRRRVRLDDAHHPVRGARLRLNGAPWALWATDYEGNLICHDLLERLRGARLSGYIHASCPRRSRRRSSSGASTGGGLKNVCWADPSVWHRTGGKNKWGRPRSSPTSSQTTGPAARGEQRSARRPRPAARPVEARPRRPGGSPFPSWHPRAGEPGAPRLFFVRDATPDRRRARGGTVAAARQARRRREDRPDWESKHGHAVAMSRYAVMSKPDTSKAPAPEEEEPRARFLRRLRERADQEVAELRRRPRTPSYIT
jgi:hypothetical protein